MFRRPSIPFLVRFTLLFIGGIVHSHFVEFHWLICLAVVLIWTASNKCGLYSMVFLVGWMHGSLHTDSISLPAKSDLLISVTVDNEQRTYKGEIVAYRSRNVWTSVQKTLYFRVSNPLPKGRLMIYAPRISFPENPSYLFTSLSGEKILSTDTAFFQPLRWHLHAKLTKLVDTKMKGVVFAMLFGSKEFLTDQRYELFRKTGGAHVLAVSGLHVGLIYGVLIFILKPLGNRRHIQILRQILVLLVLWAFAGITGFSPSVIRAVGFFSIFTLAAWKNSVAGITHALFLLLLVVGWYDPELLRSPGLQLSYVAVLSITLFQPIAEQWIKTLSSVYKVLIRALSVSFFAQLGTMPLVLYYFGGISVAGIITSLVYIPYTFVVICFAIIMLFGGPWFRSLNIPLLYLDRSVSSSMQWLMNWSWTHMTGSFSISEVLWFYSGIVLFYWCLRKPGKYHWFAFLMYLSFVLVRF